MNKVTDDLISRTEAKDFVRSERGAELLKHFPLSAIIVLKLLDEIPAAQELVEPKKVNRYIDFDGEGQPYVPETYDCGVCGKELPWKANYCPECGRAVKWE